MKQSDLIERYEKVSCRCPILGHLKDVDDLEKSTFSPPNGLGNAWDVVTAFSVSAASSISRVEGSIITPVR